VTASYRITLAGAALEFSCAADEVLVRAALRAGIELPYECNMGGCGACKLQLVSGEVDPVWPDAAGLSDRDRRRQQILACQARPKSDCEVALRAPPKQDLALEQRPVRRMVTLRSRRLLSPSLAEFDFVGDGAATFLPGQYALLEVPGIVGPRAYSMANAANDEGRWTFILRKVTGGAATGVLFDTLRPGDRLSLDGPYGKAHWRQSPRPAVCIAGGSGLAPMLAVAAAASHHQTVSLFFGTRDAADVAAVPELPGVAVTTVVSEPQDGWNGATGMVHDAVAKAIPAEAAAGSDYYLAGPRPMIDAVQRMLVLDRRVPIEQIFFDRFF